MNWLLDLVGRIVQWVYSDPASLHRFDVTVVWVTSLLMLALLPLRLWGARHRRRLHRVQAELKKIKQEVPGDAKKHSAAELSLWGKYDTNPIIPVFVAACNAAVLLLFALTLNDLSQHLQTDSQLYRAIRGGHFGDQVAFIPLPNGFSVLNLLGVLAASSVVAWYAWRVASMRDPNRKDEYLFTVVFPAIIYAAYFFRQGGALILGAAYTFFAVELVIAGEQLAWSDLGPVWRVARPTREPKSRVAKSSTQRAESQRASPRRGRLPMALKRDIRTCPYCGESIALGDCRIVATNFLTSQTGTIADRRPVSGARALDVLNGYPVVAEPGVSSTLRKLAPLRELASLEDLPARACSSCRYPLPPDIEDRTLATIAVVGIQGVGKTHFLASMWRGAYNEQGLSPFGVVEFAPDDNTAPLYGAHYFKPVFVKRDRLPGTNVDPLIRFRPLTFRMTVESKRFALLFHDIAGEVLTEREQRAATLAFLRRANAVIFLIDPLWLGALRDEHLTTPINPDDAPDFAYDQASLLRGVINDINDLGSTAEVPFAITIAKSDLLSKATGRQASRFAQAPPKGGDEWLDDIAKVGDEVRELLRALDEHALVAEAERLPRASYHAVAPIGHEGGNAAPRPLRCLDPLASVILRLPQLT